MIAITDTYTDETAVIAPADFTDTVTPWFHNAPAEITDAIADVQDQLNRGEFTVGSALDSLGLDIVDATPGERQLWNDGDAPGSLLTGIEDRETYGRAIDSGDRLQRVTTGIDITADTLTVDLVRYDDPKTGVERFAVRADGPAQLVIWDYPTERAAVARFDDHVQHLTYECGYEFATDEDDSE